MNASGSAWIAASYDGIYQEYDWTAGQYNDFPTKNYKVAQVDIYGGANANLYYYGDRNDAQVNCLAVQPDGKVVIGGRSYITDASLKRYEASGSQDNTFSAGLFTYAGHVSAESNSALFISGGTGIYWHSRDINNSYMATITP